MLVSDLMRKSALGPIMIQEDFPNVDFAYTVDGGPWWILRNLRVAGAEPISKVVMFTQERLTNVECPSVGNWLHNQLPDWPGIDWWLPRFLPSADITGNVEEARTSLHHSWLWKWCLWSTKSQAMQVIADKMNQELADSCNPNLTETSITNTKEWKDMTPITIAKQWWKILILHLLSSPSCGGTDGLKISYGNSNSKYFSLVWKHVWPFWIR